MSISRRTFLTGSAGGLATAAALGPIELLQAEEARRSNSPNEKLGFAVVGSRGQGRNHLNMLSGLVDVEVLYVCDVDEQIGQERTDEVAQKTGRRPRYVKDFRQALDDPAVDCVTTATPHHWHALVSIWSMQAGKDVYVEKPLAHNVWEGRQTVRAAQSLGRICQCGTQIRSSSGIAAAVQYVRSGELGKTQYVVGTCYKGRKPIGRLDEPYKIPSHIDYDLWCGPSQKVDLYRPRLHYDWHWDFNTGNGDMGNQGIHQMDVARWFLGTDHLSPRVISIGGRLGYEDYRDAGNTPNTQIAYHDYPAAPLIFETRGMPSSKAAQTGNWRGQTDNYRGSEIGVLVQCEKGYVLVHTYSSATAFDNDGETIKTWEGGGSHFANFIDAVRSRKPEDLNANALEGHLSSGLCHTGAISHQVGQQLTAKEIAGTLEDYPLLAEPFDRMVEHLRANEVAVDRPTITLGPWLEMDPKTETFTNHSDANSFLAREYRQSFVVPEMG